MIRDLQIFLHILQRYLLWSILHNADWHWSVLVVGWKWRRHPITRVFSHEPTLWAAKECCNRYASGNSRIIPSGIDSQCGWVHSSYVENPACWWKIMFAWPTFLRWKKARSCLRVPQLIYRAFSQTESWVGFWTVSCILFWFASCMLESVMLGGIPH
jgi:hypothetical protein